jgi:hypothetical protein
MALTDCHPHQSTTLQVPQLPQQDISKLLLLDSSNGILSTCPSTFQAVDPKTAWTLLRLAAASPLLMPEPLVVDDLP